MRMNWKKVLNYSPAKQVYEQFASGKLSGREVSYLFRFTSCAGTFRSLIRNRGVDGARKSARAALQRLEN